MILSLTNINPKISWFYYSETVFPKEQNFIVKAINSFLLADMQAGKGGELTRDETTIITGALELSEKTARDAMTPAAETFAIDVSSKLDR